MRYKGGIDALDDIYADAWWYTKPVGLDKKSGKSKLVGFFGRGRRARSRLPARSVLLLRRGLHRRPAFSPAGSVGASASQRSPPETRILACRLGRCFCFAEVSTGDPHPTTRSACLGFESLLLRLKNNNGYLTASVIVFGRGRRARTLGTRFWRIQVPSVFMRI